MSGIMNELAGIDAVWLDGSGPHADIVIAMQAKRLREGDLLFIGDLDAANQQHAAIGQQAVDFPRMFAAQQRRQIGFEQRANARRKVRRPEGHRSGLLPWSCLDGISALRGSHCKQLPRIGRVALDNRARALGLAGAAS